MNSSKSIMICIAFIAFSASAISQISEVEKAILSDAKTISDFLENSCKPLVDARAQAAAAARITVKHDRGSDEVCIVMPPSLEIAVLKGAADSLVHAISFTRSPFETLLVSGIRDLVSNLEEAERTDCVSPYEQGDQFAKSIVAQANAVVDASDEAIAIFESDTWPAVQTQAEQFFSSSSGSNEYETAHLAAANRLRQHLGYCRNMLIGTGDT